MSTVFRVERYNGDYTNIFNDVFRNRALSYKAKGLLATMLSLPPTWDFSLNGLSVIAADGIDSVRAGIKELERYGYIRRSQSKNKKGLFSRNIYMVYEYPAKQNPFYAAICATEQPLEEELSPSLDFPMTDNPIPEKPSSDFQRQLNTKE